MKSKKRLGVVSAVLGVCLSVASFTGFTALAEENTPPSFEVKTGCEDLVSFLNPIDYFTVDGKDPSLDKIDSIVLHDANGEVSADEYSYKVDDKVKHLYYSEGLDAGEYTLKITYDGHAVPDIKVALKKTPDPLAYVYGDADADYNKFVAGVKKAVEGLTADSKDLDLNSLKVDVEGENSSKTDPVSIFDIIDLDVYSSSNVLTRLCVAKAGGTFSVGSWSEKLSKITLGDTGTYAFYLEVKDPSGFELVKKEEYDLKIGVEGFKDGWYTVDDPDTVAVEAEELVIPVFTFEYKKVVDLSIDINPRAEGFVLQEYTHLKITVNNANSTKVTLLYNKNAKASAPTAVDKDGWVEATADHATFGNLTDKSTKFTPKVKGAFAVMVYAKGGEGDVQELTKFSDKTIQVTKDIQKQKLVNLKFRNFIKNNWLSLVFLGIALLCIVGIIILAFYKPTDDDKKPKKRDKVEDDVEEVVDESVEDADEEEVVEDADEEVVEDADEDAVEDGDDTAEEEVVDDTDDTAEEVAEVVDGTTEETTDDSSDDEVVEVVE